VKTLVGATGKPDLLLLYDFCLRATSPVFHFLAIYFSVYRSLERNFVPRKFRGIDSERSPLFRGRKCSFQGIPSSAEEPIPKLGIELHGTEFRGKD
jgi:hypothetical protein